MQQVKEIRRNSDVCYYSATSSDRVKIAYTRKQNVKQMQPSIQSESFASTLNFRADTPPRTSRKPRLRRSGTVGHSGGGIDHTEDGVSHMAQDNPSISTSQNIEEDPIVFDAAYNRSSQEPSGGPSQPSMTLDPPSTYSTTSRDFQSASSIQTSRNQDPATLPGFVDADSALAITRKVGSIAPRL
jgi:hypothetical protein